VSLVLWLWLVAWHRNLVAQALSLVVFCVPFRRFCVPGAMVVFRVALQAFTVSGSMVVAWFGDLTMQLPWLCLCLVACRFANLIR
jgi:hypothetical protein